MKSLRSLSVRNLSICGLPGGVFGSGLVVSHRNPLGDGKVRQAGAHRRIAGNDAVEHSGIALREDHAFAPAGGTADEVGVRRGLRVVVRDDLLGDSGDFSVGEEGKVEIGLLIAHEGEVKRTGFRLVSCIGAGYGESAGECRLVAGVVGPGGVSDDAVAASAALHHEVAVPGGFVGQCKRKAYAEFLAVYALAAIDDTIDSAVRGQRADTLSAGVRRRDGRSGGYKRGLGDLGALDLQSCQIGARICHLSAGSQRAAQKGCEKKQEFRIRHI